MEATAVEAAAVEAAAVEAAVVAVAEEYEEDADEDSVATGDAGAEKPREERSRWIDAEIKERWRREAVML